MNGNDLKMEKSGRILISAQINASKSAAVMDNNLNKRTVVRSNLHVNGLVMATCVHAA